MIKIIAIFWALIISFFGIHNVKYYGAKGNGVTDDTAAIQRALDYSNREVYVPDGTYLTTSALIIYDNTRLTLAKGATIKRNASFDNMIRNGADGVTGGYAANTNIEISGGIWDGNGDEYVSNTCVMGFGHMNNLRINDLVIKNVHGWHFLEVNGVSDAKIVNCTFLDASETTTQTEMLQLDLMKDSGGFPWFGPYDNTPCTAILIERCYFENGAKAIGSHSYVTGYKHYAIQILDCHFRDISEEAIKAYSYDNVIISGCSFYDVHYGILINVPIEEVYNYVIMGNSFLNMNKNSSSRAISVAATSATLCAREMTIGNNNIRTVGQHGIGLNWSFDVTISGNTVSGCGSCGLWVYKSSRVSVIGNQLLNNNGAYRDLRVGDTAGSSADTQDVIVTGNVLENVRADYCNRVIVTGNHIRTNWYKDATNATNLQIYSNFINSTWTA